MSPDSKGYISAFFYCGTENSVESVTFVEKFSHGHINYVVFERFLETIHFHLRKLFLEKVKYQQLY